MAETKRLTIPAAEEILGEEYKCLDHGFVRLVDYMGGDEAIVQAARVSYGTGTKKVSHDRGLIRYLMRHWHTTPSEMVELKFHAKMPIFVARQWIRHRTANVNEVSARYSILDNEFYVPEPEVLGVQSKSNRQGRGEVIGGEEASRILDILRTDALRAYEDYEYLLNEDSENPGQPRDPERSMLARELARTNLNLSFYTQWYWKIDMHNLFHFLRLRMDKHAQYEIRVYADAMADIAKRVAPIEYGAFEDYRLDAMNLSSLEVDVLRRVLNGEEAEKAAAEIIENKRERDEFFEKLERLRINASS